MKNTLLATVCVLILVGAGCNTSQSVINQDNKSNISSEVIISTSTKIATSSQQQKQLYKVISVVDGDTIKINYNGKVESVRLVGIDTPETVHPTKTVECFGKEASDKMKELVEGKTVTLVVDKSGTGRDKYQRLLRYVYLDDGTFVNKEMVKQGYAYAYVTYPFDYMDDFKTSQSEAKNNKLGLWADGVCDSFTTSSNSNTITNTTNEIEKVIPKTSCDCSSNKYNCGDFSTHNEAQSVYDCCGGVSNDIHRLDRDKDGSACETLP